MVGQYKIFEPCCDFLVTRLEGVAFEHQAGDSGGDTKCGVIQTVYDDHRKAWGLPQQSVRLITMDEAYRIYRGSYWDPIHADSLPEPLRFPLFEWVVNHGLGGGIMTLQMVLGVTMDGGLGPQTLTAIAKWDPFILAAKLLKAQADWYRNRVATHPDQVVFLETEWLPRVKASSDFIGIDYLALAA